MIIAGIGSRETPIHILNEMRKIGQWALLNKVTVRSGHAPGADWAFEEGAQERCCVYLPWKDFNFELKSKATIIVVPNDTKYSKLTDQFHPNPRALSRAGRLLMNRNACQVLGINLNKLADFIICWTKDGGPSGGTGQALRIAQANHIPILNMHDLNYNTADKIINIISQKLNQVSPGS